MRCDKKWLMLFLGGLLCPSAFSEETIYNMPRGVTAISHDIYDLHMTIFYVCVAIGVVVFSVLIYSLFKYRRSKGAVAATFHENAKLEVVWTILPFVILILMAIPSTEVLIRMTDTNKPDLTVKITGHQWKWQYQYLDSGIGFFSILSTPDDQYEGRAPKGQWYLRDVDHPLVLPIHQKVRLLITSNDVIHSWWVPELGVKKDAIPGFIQESWVRIDEPGTYRGQCSVLCGVRHGYMPIVVQALSEKDFKAWVTSQTAAATASTNAASKVWTKEELMKSGHENYDKICAACHKPDGTGTPPVFPALAGDKIATGTAKDHILKVLKGVPGTAMQAFGAQLDDADLAAIITYERNSWGNDNTSKYGKQAGGVVQPSDIKALR